MFGHIGVPPLLSRRMLETLTYLSRNHPYVAKKFLESSDPRHAVRQPDDANKSRGKSVIVVGDEVNSDNNEPVSLAMLLSLLRQPLYLRSIAHLEQVLI